MLFRCGHLRIGSHAVIAAKSGVMNDIPGGEKWLGSPAQPDTQYKREVIARRRLPDLLKRVAALEKKRRVKSDGGKLKDE